MGESYDVAVIGAGVTGCAIARELSRYQLKICVLEKAEDVCSGTSKANSGIIHGGYDAAPGTWKARLNVRGNQMMAELARQLDFPFKRNGSLVLCFSEDEKEALVKLYQRGQENKVPDLRLITGAEARNLEPNLTAAVVAALYVPSGGIVCPFGLTIALAENACDNGVEFKLNSEVTAISREAGGYCLTAGDRVIRARYVVNAAGVYADVLHNMVSSRKLTITARKGAYCLLDKTAGQHVSRTIFQLPGRTGKGILVTPTVHGNLLLGPTAADVDDKEETATSPEEVAAVMRTSAVSVKELPYRQVITAFAGLRAHESGADFVIGEAPGADGFFDAAGMESPGLSCAPAVGLQIAEMIAQKAAAERKADFKETRKGIPDAAAMTKQEWAQLVKERPDYGQIVCRCENISEGAVRDAVNRTLGAVSLDGIKRRVRQGMGRCQAGFCSPRAMEILAEELGIGITEVCKNTAGSRMLTGKR